VVHNFETPNPGKFNGWSILSIQTQRKNPSSCNIGVSSKK